MDPYAYDQSAMAAQAVANGWNKHPKTLTFPNDLDNIHYMQFHAHTTKKKNRSTARTKKTHATITLPIPANLQLQYAADYEDTGIGIAGALISDQMTVEELVAGGKQAYTDVSGGISNFTKKFSSGMDIDATSEDPEQSFGEKLSGAVSGMKNQVVGAGVAAGIGFAGAASIGVLGTAVLGGDIIGGAIKGGFKKMGFIVNPHLATIFTGVGKKSHNFSFKFIAKNAQESGMIQDICEIFRFNMLPKYKYEKFGLTYPNEWEINFSKATEPYLYKIGNCVLKSFNVTYNGGGIPVFHSGTNAPIEVNISLGFTETFIETRDDFRKAQFNTLSPPTPGSYDHGHT